MQALKRKKQYEEQRDQLVATQFNVENLAFQQEQAEITTTTVQAMQQATADLKAQQGKIDASTVERVMDDMQDMADDLKEVQEMLTRPQGSADADEDLEAEFAAMQADYASQVLAGADPASSGPVVAPSVPAAVPAAGYA